MDLSDLMQAHDSIGLQMHMVPSFLGFYMITCSRAPMNVHKSSELNAYCESNYIKQQFIFLNTLEQNGVLEHKNDILIGIMITM